MLGHGRGCGPDNERRRMARRMMRGMAAAAMMGGWAGAGRHGARGRPDGYGADGPFGRNGPFGPDGPFGRGGPFGPGGPYGGGGGRRGKRFAGEELRLIVLSLLAEGPQHGYQLIRAIAEKSHEAYSPSPGVLYPLLDLLADMGLAEEMTGEGGKRRSFAVTEAGRTELADKAAEVEALMARLAAMGEERGRVDPAPVRRAMMNLRAATMQRLARGGEDGEIAFEVAALLDEAAQKIERLGRTGASGE